LNSRIKNEPCQLSCRGRRDDQKFGGVAWDMPCLACHQHHDGVRENRKIGPFTCRKTPQCMVDKWLVPQRSLQNHVICGIVVWTCLPFTGLDRGFSFQRSVLDATCINHEIRINHEIHEKNRREFECVMERN